MYVIKRQYKLHNTYFIIALLLIVSDSVVMLGEEEEVKSSVKATCIARFSPFAVRTGIRLDTVDVGVVADIGEGGTTISVCCCGGCCCCCCCICKRTGGGIITLTFGFGKSEGFLTTVVVASELTCVAVVADSSSSLVLDDAVADGDDCVNHITFFLYRCVGVGVRLCTSVKPSPQGMLDNVRSVCLKRFASTNNLWAHMRTHTGEKPLHINVKPHICEIGGKSFTLSKTFADAYESSHGGMTVQWREHSHIRTQ
uniref:C2H2-type domain-containing protein n=1 Tax=Glossina brevipalpis TaxID=37001 RepID=A0A1A9W4G9_9MUSC